MRALSMCTSHRVTGSLCVETSRGVRRVVFREGDIVTAASGIDDEALVAFLGARGDIPKDVALRLRSKVPAFGRHAGAALIANGHLSQDQLWPVLRAHAEWVLGEVMNAEKGTATMEPEPPGRLKAEPSVFGGATGAEVIIEAVRRVVPAELAIMRLGGLRTSLRAGANADLLSECALAEPEQALVQRANGAPLSEVLASSPQPEVAPMIYALVTLGVLETIAGGTDLPPPRPEVDVLDEEALRTRVRARLGLVQEGDYFALLGVSRTATSYEIRRAYLDLRRAFEPSRALTVKTADLADELRLIVEVLDEAHEVLRDQTRRDRYRRAIEAAPH